MAFKGRELDKCTFFNLTSDFPSPTGGGSNTPPPSISAPIGRREKRKRKFESSSKIIPKLFRSMFRLNQNCAPRAKKWPNFRVFRDCQTSFRKSSIISGTSIARVNPKTAFERELNSPSLELRQI